MCVFDMYKSLDWDGATRCKRYWHRLHNHWIKLYWHASKSTPQTIIFSIELQIWFVPVFRSGHFSPLFSCTNIQKRMSARAIRLCLSKCDHIDPVGHVRQHTTKHFVFINNIWLGALTPNWSRVLPPMPLLLMLRLLLMLLLLLLLLLVPPPPMPHTEY